jgi:hypothetical protein
VDRRVSRCATDGSRRIELAPLRARRQGRTGRSGRKWITRGHPNAILRRSAAPFRLHGHGHYRSSAAMALACASENPPEICNRPSNGVNDDWVGCMIGAEITWPLRSMPIIW